MPHATTPHGTPALASTLPAVALAGANASGAVLAAQATAQNAVDAVMKVADVQAAAGDNAGPSVNLGFDFGDDHLAVRVEMSGGQVHTRFTTSSAELQQAVATQWSAMTSQGDSQGQRSYQFAQPQFAQGDATSDSGGSPGSFSFGAGAQGQEGRQSGSAFASGSVVATAPVLETTPGASVESEPASANFGASRLNVFA